MKRRLTAILLALCMELPCMMPATVIAAETEAIETENVGTESESAAEGKLEEAVQTETAIESEETDGEKVEEAVQTEAVTESEETDGEKTEEAVQTEAATESEGSSGKKEEESENVSLKVQGKASRSPAKMLSRDRTETCTVTYTDGVNGTVFQDQIYEVTLNRDPDTNEVISSTPETRFDGTPTRTGYYFTGWSPAEKNPITENTTYTAQWSAKKYRVLLVSNMGGSGDSTDWQDFVYDEEKPLKEAVYYSNSRKGYVLAGWNTERDGSGTGYSAGQVVKNLTESGSIWLYAQWKEDRNGNGIADDEEQRYTVQYIANPDDPADPSNQTTGNLLAGDQTPAYEGGTPARTGYTFAGWEPAVAETVTGNVTYTAKWSAKKYRVLLVSNTGGSGESTDWQDFVYDEEKPLKEAVYYSNSRKGYVLAGWNTERDGSGTGYSAGQVVKNLTESGSIWLYAQWKEDRNGNGIADDEEQRYTVQYIANPDDPADPSNQTTGNLLAGDQTPAYEGGTPARTGYEFAGWEPDVSDTVTGDAAYAAKWKAKSYKVTLVLNGGTLADEKNVTSYTYAKGAVLPTADNVTFLCHTFDGWYADSSFSGSPEAEISKSSTGDRVFYAKWTESHTPGKAVKENEKAKTCEANGTYDNVIYCAVCSAELSRNTVTVPASGHNLEKVEKKEASCTEAGYEAYWKCKTCGKLFSDEDGTVEISNPIEIKASGHNLEKVEKKEATTEKEGNSTYWFCEKCNKYFSDEKAENEIKKEDTVLAKLSAVSKKETEASSEKTTDATKADSTTDRTTNSAPKTGDSTDVQFYVILMLVSIGAAAGVGAKRKFKTRR